MPRESEWLEFKRNDESPDRIGKNIAALANSAALLGKPSAFIVWGVDDSGHSIVGTTFRPRMAKKGNQELENWLVTQFKPAIDIQIHEGSVDGRAVVVFEIQPARSSPVRFRGIDYIRIGSYTKMLADHPAKEGRLWAVLNDAPFEAGVVVNGVPADDVLSLIDYPECFRLLERPLPENRAAILDTLASEGVIVPTPDGEYGITNGGAILFARSLDSFDRLRRKALRVVIYRGTDRVRAVKEQEGTKGYAVGFEGAVGYINDQLPQNEEIGQALRREVRMFPEIAIRELVANALIHQDFSVHGTGPIVELFSDRMEVSNPGIPLIETLRFIDEPPRSRNEKLARLMRRMNICEERGSGIDKVIVSVERFQLPAPDFRVAGQSTVSVLYGPREFGQMDRDERVRACYQHACLLHVSGKRMSNGTLRERLGIPDEKHYLASKVISDTIDAGLLRPSSPSQSKKYASYLPFWA